MAIVYKQYNNIPLASGYVARYPLNKANYNFCGTVHYDNTWSTNKPLVVYFHGSGSTGYLSNTDPLVTGLVNAGYAVLGMRYFSVADSSVAPFPTRYGNVNSPMFMSHFVKLAWFVEAGIQFATASLLNATDPDIKISNVLYLFGHSMGASAVTTWSALAGTAGFSSKTVVKGIIASAPTVGGLGGKKWNNVNRNLGTLSHLIQSVQHDIVYCYNNLDDYAPPDFARRLQYSVPDGKKGYFVSLGNSGHIFTAKLCTDVFNELNSNLPPKYNGNLIVPV